MRVLLPVRVAIRVGCRGLARRSSSGAESSAGTFRRPLHLMQGGSQRGPMANPRIDAAKNEAGEAALIARALARDAVALAEIMRQNNRRLYRAAWGILRDEQEAEDAVQDCYLKAFAALPSFRGEAALSTWLTRIAINEALMRRRKRKAQA